MLRSGLLFFISLLTFKLAEADFQFITPPHDAHEPGPYQTIPSRKSVYTNGSKLLVEWEPPEDPDSLMSLAFAKRMKGAAFGYYVERWLFKKETNVAAYEWTVGWEGDHEEDDFFYFIMYWDIPPNNEGLNNVTGANVSVSELFYIQLAEEEEEEEERPVGIAPTAVTDITIDITAIITQTVLPTKAAPSIESETDPESRQEPSNTSTVPPEPSSEQTPSETTASPAPQFPTSQPLSRGAIAGIVVSILVAIALFGGAGWYFSREFDCYEDEEYIEDPPPYEETEMRSSVL